MNKILAITRRNFDIKTERVALRGINQKYYLNMQFPPRLLPQYKGQGLKIHSVGQLLYRGILMFELVVHSIATLL